MGIVPGKKTIWKTRDCSRDLKELQDFLLGWSIVVSLIAICAFLYVCSGACTRKDLRQQRQQCQQCQQPEQTVHHEPLVRYRPARPENPNRKPKTASTLDIDEEFELKMPRGEKL